MRKQVVFSFTLLFLLIFQQGLAQTIANLKDYAQSIDFKYKTGFLLAHRESMAHLPMSHFHSFEMTYNFESRGHRGWEQAHNNPKFGISALVMLNANQEVLGNSYGLSGRVTLPKRNWGRNKNWYWLNDMSFGLGYLERKFDLLENPKNVAIGSHVNLLIILGTEFQYRNENRYVSLGIDFTHFSNSGTIKPNLGLNIPSIRVGVGFMTKTQSFHDEIIPFDRADLELVIFGAASLKNNYEFQKQLFPVFGLSTHLTKAQGKRFRYAYGLDLTYNEANRNFITSPLNQSIWRTAQIGIYNGWELDINKCVFFVGMGAYLHNRVNPFGWFYHRFGGRYHFGKKWYWHGSVRSHWAKADFFETGLGYRISIRQ